jgi:polyphenol oxidase
VPAHKHNCMVGAHGGAPSRKNITFIGVLCGGAVSFAGKSRRICSEFREMGVFRTDDVALNIAGLEQYGAFMAFSLRKGGVSPRPFDSLNFSSEEGDSVENVDRNFRIFGEKLGIASQQIVTCHQIHGDRVAIISDRPNRPPEADAIISTVPSIYPAVKTADCVPILLVDPVQRISAAVHVGWRGAVLRIVRKVLRLLNDKFRSNPSDLLVAIGPSIGKCCYEVDDNVLEPLRDNFSDAERFLNMSIGPASLPATDSEQPSVSENSRKAFLDLPGITRFELISVGVPEANIHPVDLCTSCRSDLFFSHRRDRGRTGRHIAVTGFKLT